MLGELSENMFEGSKKFEAHGIKKVKLHWQISGHIVFQAYRNQTGTKWFGQFVTIVSAETVLRLF